MALINDVINDEGITTLDLPGPETGDDADPDTDVVSVAYLTFLARQATEAELAHWNDAAGAGLSSEDVRDAIANSQEASTIVAPIKSVYQAIFGREPNQDELVEAAGKIREGDPLEDIRELLTGSGEEMLDTGVAELFVADLYQRLLDRLPDEAGLADWVSSGKTWSEIVDGFVNSSEFQATWESNPDEGGQSETDSSGDVLAALISSKTQAQDQLDKYIGNLDGSEASGLENVMPAPLDDENTPPIQWPDGYAFDAGNEIAVVGGDELEDSGLV